MTYVIHGRNYSGLDEIRTRIAALDAEYNGQFPSNIRSEWNALNETYDEIVARKDRVRQLGAAPGSREGLDLSTGLAPRDDDAGRPAHVLALRDAGLRAVERHSEDLTGQASTRLEHVLRQADPLGADARYLAAIGDPAYNSAFGKLLADPNQGQLRFTPQETAAVQEVAAADQMRGLIAGTGSAGGFALPFTLDPTVMLTSDGSLNPIREISTVQTITTHDWKGVSSAGVTASYDAEASEVSDDTPTLAQPTVVTAMGRAFVPFSMELGDDWTALQPELARLISDGRDQLDATMFLTGSGTNQPQGVLTGLSNTQRVQTAGTATYGVSDPWALKAAIPARYIGNTTFAAAPATWDTTYRFVGTDSAEPPQMATREGDFLGRPKVEWSTMATGASTSTKLIIGGDFRAGFVIADRLGMTIELVPHLFGANRRPTGERGIFARWRTGSTVVNPNALRFLEVK